MRWLEDHYGWVMIVLIIAYVVTLWALVESFPK